MSNIVVQRAIKVFFLCLSDSIVFILFFFYTCNFEFNNSACISGKFSTYQFNLLLIGIFGFLWIIWMGFIKSRYTRYVPFWTELQEILRGVAFFATVHIAFISIHPHETNPTTIIWIIKWILVAAMIPFMRQMTKRMLRHFNIWQTTTVIFGTGENALEALFALKSEKLNCFRIKAFITESTTSTKPQNLIVEGVPVISLQNHDDMLNEFVDCHCVIALESQEHNLRDKWIRQLVHSGVKEIFVIPPTRGVPLYSMETIHYFRHEVMAIRYTNNLSRWFAKTTKRMFDIIVASLLLVIISPLFAILMAIIKRDKGPAMFAHERIGLNGQTFKCMKFRSMVLNADEMLKELFDNNPSAKTEWEKDHKLKNDPRITAIGHILRKTSLDELPQLLNVLKGEMSLIGPRPVVEEELIRYGDDITYYLMVRPGMTGLWQISGRNDVDYNTRVYMDCWYVKNWALWTDIVIMCKTIPVLFERNNGAY